jgi:hypothetical protein
MIGYGLDTWCATSLQPGRYARRATLVMQAIIRRLSTPLGTLQGFSADENDSTEESAYGFDVVQYVGAVGEEVAASSLPLLLEAEIGQDDRISPTLTVTADVIDDPSQPNGKLLQIQIDGQLADETEDFALTLSVSKLTLQVLGGFQ